MGELRYSSTILDLVLLGGEWSALRSTRFTPGGNQLDSVLGGPQSRPGRGEEQKCRESNINKAKLEFPANEIATHFCQFEQILERS
jgi:hypothetical protein